ncbi:hypothetical protein RND71_020114 [Anisodus tanguticus]|uniref:Carboxypeptidase A inhibitor-like domain-containing protein n=1 Tax=Anisodus tanguticus TaxID=243964 RepID=A0AAE1VA16_9SOLA|nr:hypothetical protein RND71_020114 [Anisodus tanguticus]
MALRDLPDDVAAMKEKLLPLGDIVTCLKYCNVESDCSGGWVCYNCVPSAFAGWRSQCDKFTVTGEDRECGSHYSTKRKEDALMTLFPAPRPLTSFRSSSVPSLE